MIMDTANIPSLEKGVKGAESSTKRRKEVLDNLNELVSNTLLKTTRVSIKVQTDQAVWNAIPEKAKYEYYQYDESTDDEK